LEVAVVEDAVRDVREGKKRRVAAVARGELVKARAMQASIDRPKRKRLEDEEDDENEKASDAEDHEDEARDKDEGGGERTNEVEGKGADEDGDENEDEEDEGGAVPAKRRWKATKVSGPPGTRILLTRPTGADEGRGVGSFARGTVRAVHRRRC
jgi:hypothetical protein